MKPTLADEILTALTPDPYRLRVLPGMTLDGLFAVWGILEADWPKPPAPVLTLRFILTHAVEVVP